MKGTRFQFAGTLAYGLLFFSIATRAGTPYAPPNLRSAWVDTVSAVLTWDDVPDADWFRVYRFDSVNQTWSLVSSNLLVPMFRESPSSTDGVLNYAVTAGN